MNLRELLFVAWQHPESRKILPIGRLLRQGETYEFAYIRAVQEAQQLGFEPLLTFPVVDEVYRSHELPPLFSNRLMPKSRPEFAQYLSELGLSVGAAEPFAVLSRSGGRRVTDRLEVFSPPAQCESVYQGVFLLRGVRHVPHGEEALANLPAQSRLFVMADVQNPANPAALALGDEQKHLLGYVPDYLASELATARAESSCLRVTVLKVNPPPAAVHQRVLCQYQCPERVGGVLFRGPRYQPISKQATDIAA
jgi:hypothetical protein